jgi:spore coat protein A
MAGMNTSDPNGRRKGPDSTRRRLLNIGGAFALSALFPSVRGEDGVEQRTNGSLSSSAPARLLSGHRVHRTPPQDVTAAKTLRKFEDPLPIPATIVPRTTVHGVPFYRVEMTRVRKKLHRELPPTVLWTYNGAFPAPTFEVRRGHPIAVQWENKLAGGHFLPIDTTIHGAEPGLPSVRTVVHLHGAKTMPESDGYPEAWFTKDFGQTGPHFATKVYHYPNDQQATALWYHDHAVGITRLNVYAGLGGGLYVIRDDHEDSLGLPSGRYEIPLVIQDRFFNPDGSLLYPVVAPGDPDPRVPPIWIPEFFGDTVLVNGKIWPFLEVEPRRYRFRILNGSNARVYRMTLQESTVTGQRLGRPGPAFHQIGSDGGLLPVPVTRTQLTLAPAERQDVIIDFSGSDGKVFVLDNDAPAPFPDGDDIVPNDIMIFKVSEPLRGPDQSRLPAALNRVPLLSPAAAVKTRDVVLSELDSAAGSPIMAMINDAHWDDPVTESPRAGSIEIWRIINTTGDAHPIHLHLVQFQVLDRQPFDPAQFPPDLVFTGAAQPPENNERPAWKDTVLSYPGTVTRIIAKFDLPAGTQIRPGQKFRYVYHCHILEHEENEMMRPYDVVG